MDKARHAGVEELVGAAGGRIVIVGQSHQRRQTAHRSSGLTDHPLEAQGPGGMPTLLRLQIDIGVGEDFQQLIEKNTRHHRPQDGADQDSCRQHRQRLTAGIVDIDAGREQLRHHPGRQIAVRSGHDHPHTAGRLRRCAQVLDDLAGDGPALVLRIGAGQEPQRAISAEQRRGRR